MWFLFQIAKSKVPQNEGRAGRNRTTAERVRPEYEEDTVGYYEEDTVAISPLAIVFFVLWIVAYFWLLQE